MKDEELLAEVEELLRTIPPQSAFMKQENDEDNDEWLGRVASVLSEWDSIRCAFENMRENIKALQHNHNIRTTRRALRTLLVQSQHDLRMKTVGPLSIAVGANKPFIYFDEIRKITEQAREDLLFVDPYLDAEFVSRYLPQIDAGVTVRLLTSKKLSSLLPAVDAFVGRCCTARSKSLTSLCRLQSHPAQYVSGIPSAAILLSISHPIRCSTRCLANVRARISGPMIAL